MADDPARAGSTEEAEGAVPPEPTVVAAAAEPAPARVRRYRGPVVVFFSGLFSLAFLAVLGLGAAVYWGKLQFSAPGPLPEDRIVLIPRGTRTDEIVALLKRENVIETSWLFQAGTYAARAQSRLKAGEYRFPKNASMARVLETLVEGKSILHQVTVPEGLTSEQIVARLREDPVLVGEVRDVPPEGSLLPETYSFVRGTTRQEILEKMRAGQRRLVEDVWRRRSEGLPLKSPGELVTLASIVEKETGRADERNRVAAVFVNRMRRSMRLQSDPTIIYGIAGGKGVLDRPILRSDIDRPTPYNTYTIDGLPPTPIANPGRQAIEATANPSKTDDLFFVADGTGGHAFAATLDEHNRNVARWRELERRQRGEAAPPSPAPGGLAAPPPAPPAATAPAARPRPAPALAAPRSQPPAPVRATPPRAPVPATTLAPPAPERGAPKPRT